MTLKDKVVLITGGSTGIGLATAKMAKERGAKVLITGRNLDKLKRAADEHDLDFFNSDVSDEQQVLKTYEYMNSNYENLDVLVNNAGFGYFEGIETLDKSKFDSVLGTNVVGAALMTREATKIFKNQIYGNIVNIASTAALKGFAGGTAYVATKFALRGMSECWRAELRKYNVRVILVNPSEVQTEFVTNAGFEERNFNPTKLVSEDIAHSIITALEIDDRGFIPELTVFATNPKD